MEKLPPMAMGLAKSATDLMNTSRKALAMPGRTRGIVTELKVRHLEEPRSRAASSMLGSMDCSMPASSRNAMGK